MSLSALTMVERYFSMSSTILLVHYLIRRALLCVEAREEDLLVTSGITENGSYTVVIALQSNV